MQGVYTVVPGLLGALTSHSCAMHYGSAFGQGGFEVKSGIRDGFTGCNQGKLGKAVELGNRLKADLTERIGPFGVMLYPSFSKRPFNL